jgi:CheY-like chemotaxis protein
MQKHILLVEDESALRRSLSLGLNQFGYDVEPCENGVSALNKLDLYSKNNIDLDLVVLDIQLPDINGKKLSRIIKAKYPDLSMLFITGYFDKLDFTEIEDFQLDGLMEKPFSVDDLNNRFLKIFEKKPEKKILEQKDTSKTFSANILIKIEEEKDFFQLYNKLFFMENVLYCDATRGDIDIFLLIQANSKNECREIFDNKVKNLDAVQECEFLPIGIPLMNDYLKDIIQDSGISPFDDFPGMNKSRDNKNSVCSYCIVEVEREKLDIIYPIIRLTDNVLFCDYISGTNRLVLMLYGTQYTEIDKVIANKIISLEGVLKVKKYPIINMYEM